MRKIYYKRCFRLYQYKEHTFAHTVNRCIHHTEGDSCRTLTQNNMNEPSSQ